MNVNGIPPSPKVGASELTLPIVQLNQYSTFSVGSANMSNLFRSCALMLLSLSLVFRFSETLRYPESSFIRPLIQLSAHVYWWHIYPIYGFRSLVRHAVWSLSFNQVNTFQPLYLAAHFLPSNPSVPAVLYTFFIFNDNVPEGRLTCCSIPFHRCYSPNSTHSYASDSTIPF